MPPQIPDTTVKAEPRSHVPRSATRTPTTSTTLIRNFTVLMSTTNTPSSKLYSEGKYTCVATSKYGTDVKHFVIKGGEKMRYFETNTMHTELQPRSQGLSSYRPLGRARRDPGLLWSRVSQNLGHYN